MTQPQQIPVSVAQITVVDVFAKQVEMGVQLAVIAKQLEAIPDHEQRIRVLELARAKVWGAGAVLGALCGGGAAWIALAINRR